ncbi:3-deoxy-7-phosphoheptulonate synthase [Clostridium intestinale]|uniref:3-deoxy-7-phosphoheptulonate synthase n=2 Tax=Clostridium intestinale TaxID=36845 RepID=U2Q0N0_9CLOT|nr:3-deoxy-7-phosphoheptulonate synthase [Clostridium intestinale]ERK29564.1 3-deoxy-7-phosphoheptulonate synthase [Clostridium intestinale URNW]SHI24492.1 3-deoxy-D-arabinoheptulosonate-7-phosphate synthase [Clostridium intestinale DSM 6191]
MIVIMNSNVKDEEIKKVVGIVEGLGVQTNVSKGDSLCVIGLVGDTSRIDGDKLMALDGVDKVLKVQEPYKKANRLFKPDNSIIDVRGNKIGGSNFSVMAGPCSVESEEQIIEVAEAVKKSGANFLRGGAFKPRTSPYSFQGLELEGLNLLMKAREATGLPIVTEIMSTDYIDEFVEKVDVIQVGARNMQNFDLLKQLGKCSTPILLKRGLSATYEEWIMSAEYIMAGGNENVILCERGIRTFETYTRNTLDLSAIPVLRKLTHLPIIIDPSHAGGMWWLVESMAKAAVVAGADGLMIEVHNDPANALSDGGQSLKPQVFDDVMKKVKVLVELEERKL